MQKYLITAAVLALLTTAAQAQAPSTGEDTLACRTARGEFSAGEMKGVSPYVLEQIRQKDAKRRQDAQASCDEIKREAAGRVQKYNAEQGERARQEQARKDAQAEAAKADADQRAKAQAEYDALPDSVKAAREAEKLLWNGYRFYAHVKWCYDVRDGYAYKYINDTEIERAAAAIRFIADKAKKLDATINTDDVWQRALKSIKGYLEPRETPMNDQASICQHSMRELFKLSPTPVYTVEKP